jgi:hypothetical protein
MGTRVLCGALAISLLAGVLPADANCRYFRTKAHAERCKVLPPDAPTETDALLQGDKEGPAVQVVCSCEYALEGAAAISPQCDLERTDEPSFTTPSSDARNPCRESRHLCEELCPKDASD